MKKSILKIVGVLCVSAFLFSSCGGGEAQETENTETEASAETPSEPEVNQVEVDALRMAELACLTQANLKSGQEAGLTTEEIQAQNAPMNMEMQEINDRFNAEYANTEKQTEFQGYFEPAFQACSGN